MIIAFLLATVMNFFGYWFSDKMILRQYKATETNPENHPSLYQLVARLAAEARLPMPTIAIIGSLSFVCSSFHYHSQAGSIRPSS